MLVIALEDDWRYILKFMMSFFVQIIIFVNNLKQPLHKRNSFKNILKEDYKKALKS